MKILLFMVIVSVLALGCTPRQVQEPVVNRMVVDFADTARVINPNIYGHFAEHLGRCIYGGIWVGVGSDIPNINGYRLDVLEALKRLNIPVLRWPGGCFADTYNWRDGVGPAHKRPTLQNAHWGNTIEDNSFGTHEFLNFTEMLGAEAYVNINMGTGSVREMVEWIEYMTSDLNVPMANLRRENGRQQPWEVRFLGLGNEMWGCGGEITPEYYAEKLRHYSTFARRYGGPEMVRIAAGPHGSLFDWTEVVMRKAHGNIEALSLHYYTLPTGEWGYKSSATGFDEALYFSTLRNTLRMDEIIAENTRIMDQFDPERRVGLYVAEWGTWTEVEPGTNPAHLFQQNTMRDALVASLNFNIFHSHERVRMANIAQTVNVLQAVILTEGNRMILTPTYHVFDMYQVHMGATYLPSVISTKSYIHSEDTIPAVSGTASMKNGKVHVSVNNVHPTETVSFDVDLSGGNLSGVSAATIITAPAFNSFNTFDNPEVVVPASFSGYNFADGVLTVQLPPHSIVTLRLE